MSTKTSIRFRGFDEHGEVRVYQHGILPHWRQAGCTYFVTFRQDDSLPRPVLREIEYERHRWLAHRGIDPKERDWKRLFAQLSHNDQRIYERVVTTKINEHLDKGHGSCVLRHREIAEKVATSLNHFDGVRLWTGDYVIMPNHVHALMTPLPGCELEDILHSIKSFTANEINRMIETKGTFWQRQSYDHIVRDYEQLEAYQRYIEANPKKANLKLGEYVYANATYIPGE